MKLQIFPHVCISEYVYFLYSAPYCEVYEIEGWKHSFLTQAFLEALNAPGYKKIHGTISELIMQC